MPPLVYKALGRDNVRITPFRVYKTQQLTYVSGSNDIDALNVVTAVDFSDLASFDPNTAVINVDGTLQGPLFKSVKHIFYRSGSVVSYGDSSGSANFIGGETFVRDFPLSGSVYVVNIPQMLYGEGIRKGSFVLTANATTSIDDGNGRLFISGTTSVIGNVFYRIGVAVIGQSALPIGSGSVVNVTFDSSMTIYEHEVIATVDPYEFNASMNPSAFSQRVDMSGSVADAMVSGALKPYITTIGLYNDRYELVAVAKLPTPVKRLSQTQQSFVIRIDT